MSICRDLIQRMGGTIGLESELGKGTRVRFSLPLPRADGPAAKDNTLPALFPKLRVLVVDDHPVNRAVAVAFLQKLGVETDEFAGFSGGIDGI